MACGSVPGTDQVHHLLLTLKAAQWIPPNFIATICINEVYNKYNTMESAPHFLRQGRIHWYTAWIGVRISYDTSNHSALSLELSGQFCFHQARECQAMLVCMWYAHSRQPNWFMDITSSCSWTDHTTTTGNVRYCPYLLQCYATSGTLLILTSNRTK